jgi:pyrimidine operon attenuation protein / uracil phosphoribosyltransferase
VKVLLNNLQVQLTVQRLCHQIHEMRLDPANTVLLGIQPRGIHLLERMRTYMLEKLSTDYNWGSLDITFYRDDVAQELHLPKTTDLKVSLTNKEVVLVDDVLFTGRTIRSAFDALLDFGRPSKVQLCVLVNRRYSRQFPIEPNYAGLSIDSLVSQKVRVQWQDVNQQDAVVLLDS